MLEARRGKEIVVKVKNSIGVLFDLSKIIAEKGIGLVAVQAAVGGEDGTVRLVTEDNLRAMDALRANNYAPREEGVILIELPKKPGMLKYITEHLVEKDLDIHHLYSTSSVGEAQALVVFHSANDEQAMILLNQLQL